MTMFQKEEEEEAGSLELKLSLSWASGCECWLSDVGGDWCWISPDCQKKKKKEDGDRATRSEEAFSYSKSGVYQ